jgi:hypothetical protein
MRTPFIITTILLLTGYYISQTFMLILIELVTSLLVVPLVMVLAPYFKELIFSNHRPPIIGPISTLVIHFWELHVYMTSLARKYPTFRFIAPLNSEIYTVDPANIEYILKTNFANYSKVLINCYLSRLVYNSIMYKSDFSDTFFCGFC